MKIIGCMAVMTLVAFLAVYIYPFYLKRCEIYVKHEFVLENQCTPTRAHPRIHYDLLTYDGVQTNCEEARVFVAVPIFVGALIDTWKASPIYAMIYVTDPWIGLAYTVITIVFVIVGVQQLRIFLTERDVIASTRERGKTMVIQTRKQK